jgi:hypothetical protein
MYCRIIGLFLLVLASLGQAGAQTQWMAVENVPNIGAGAVALLTDGRVLVHDESGNPGTLGNWWTLSPDANGNYATGTWTQVASMPSNYAPEGFASAVLPDGRYLVEGGEYNLRHNDTTLGAIYDPVANVWTLVNPPAGWMFIGDAPSAVLADGRFLMGSCCDDPALTAIFDATTLSWTDTGSGKFDIYFEEGITLLPGGKLLDVDTYGGGLDQPNGKNYELYDPSTGSWTSQGDTPVQLWDSGVQCGGNGSHEIGPAVLMPNGTVFATGANSCGSAHTAVYTVSADSWVAGPDFPDGLDIADGPAALEVNGKVLMMTSRGLQGMGATFFEWNGSTLTQIVGPPNAPNESSSQGHLLMLPTGQLLFADTTSDVELFTSTGNQYRDWTPSVLLKSAVMAHGSTTVLNGFKFNGATQNNAYGDDFQDATNYPLVRLTNSSGQAYYLRTHDHSTMAVGYSGPTYTHVDIPRRVPAGAYNLQVVVNGIASQNYAVGIR